LGWSPAGNPRYIYRIVAGATDCGFPPAVLTANCNQLNYTSNGATPPAQGLNVPQATCAVQSSTSAAIPALFTATAVSNLDSDAVIDCWMINQARLLVNALNDVG
jgi:hypothetical protein